MYRLRGRKRSHDRTVVSGKSPSKDVKKEVSITRASKKWNVPRSNLLKKASVLNTTKVEKITKGDNKKAKNILIESNRKVKDSIASDNKKAKKVINGSNQKVKDVATDNKEAKRVIISSKQKTKDVIVSENKRAKRGISGSNQKAKDVVPSDSKKAKIVSVGGNQKEKDAITSDNKNAKRLSKGSDQKAKDVGSKYGKKTKKVNIDSNEKVKNISTDDNLKAKEVIIDCKVEDVPTNVNKSAKNIINDFSKPIKTDISCKNGSLIFNELEEYAICNWVMDCTAAGFIITEDQVLNSLQHLLTELNRITPFPLNRPSYKWFRAFLLRNKEIAERVLKKPMFVSSASKEQIQLWFEETSTYLQTIGQFDILNNPDRVFNLDDVGFFNDPKEGRSLFKRSDLIKHQIPSVDQRKHQVVLFAVSANGKVAPPMMIFQHSVSLNYMQKAVPDSWGVGISETGWTTGKTFYEYITTVLNPWLVENNTPKPVILFLNRQTFHLTLQLYQFCCANGIILIGLLPSVTKTIQPLDVTVLPCLEKRMVEEAEVVRAQSRPPILKRTDFCSTLEKAVKASATPDLIQDGFEKCGLLPWNPSVMNTIQISEDVNMKEKTDDMSLDLPEEENSSLDYKITLKVLESEISKGKLILFYSLKNEDNWVAFLDRKDVELFALWKKILLKSLEPVAADNSCPELFCEAVFSETPDES